jgi:hypothetical protein
MPDPGERRIDAWTALAAEPAVRAAERAITTGSAAVLADTLAVSAAAESRRRFAHVLDLKARAERDPRRRDAYHQAADDLRGWAATVYLAALRDPHARVPRTSSRPGGTSTEPGNAYTEESISLRRMGPRPPFPGQRKRRPPSAGVSPDTQREDRAAHRPCVPT